ncbi:MAG: hypothetical protein M1833_001364 [Piccolia ochrophora]|nr:MAG: hypothetical protein M1833_001364 [Piccolia ochrophora]
MFSARRYKLRALDESSPFHRIFEIVAIHEQQDRQASSGPQRSPSSDPSRRLSTITQPELRPTGGSAAGDNDDRDNDNRDIGAISDSNERNSLEDFLEDDDGGAFIYSDQRKPSRLRRMLIDDEVGEASYHHILGEEKSRRRNDRSMIDLNAPLVLTLDEQVLYNYRKGLIDKADLPDLFENWDWESPLFGPLPKKNPFWEIMPELDGCLLNKRYQLAREYDRRWAAPTWRIVADTPIKEREELQHDDNAIRVLAGLIFFRRLYLSNNLIEMIVPGRMGDNNPLQEAWFKKVMRFNSRFQSSIMTRTFNGVRRLVEVTGGLRVWRTSTEDQRRAMFVVYFDQDPLMTCFVIYKSFWEGVDFANIYFNASEERVKWQRYCKTIFVWLCEDTWKYRVRPGPAKDKRERSKRYKSVKIALVAYSTRPAIVNDIGLGDIREVPIRQGGLANQNRRPVPGIPVSGTHYHAATV